MLASRLWNIFSEMFMMPKSRAGFSLADKPVARVWGCISLLGSSSNVSHIYTVPVKWQLTAPDAPHVHSRGEKKDIKKEMKLASFNATK